MSDDLDRCVWCGGGPLHDYAYGCEHVAGRAVLRILVRPKIDAIRGHLSLAIVERALDAVSAVARGETVDLAGVRAWTDQVLTIDAQLAKHLRDLDGE